MTRSATRPIVTIAVAALVALMITTTFETTHPSTSAPAIASGAPTTSGQPYAVLHEPAGAGRGRNHQHHRSTRAAYSLLRTPSGRPLHWGCAQTIAVWVDPAGAPADFIAQVHMVFRRVAVATGYKFVFKAQPRPAGDPTGGIAISVGAVTGRSDAPDGGPAIAMTSPAYDDSPTDPGRITGVSEVFSPWLMAHRSLLLPSLLHETGHAMGLAHVAGPEVMNPAPTARRYTPGDLAGLRAVSEAATCNDNPVASTTSDQPDPLLSDPNGSEFLGNPTPED